MSTNAEAAKGFDKLRELQRIEKLVQERWNDEHVFEGNAPADYKAGASKKKFMATFPFPYMNGLIHLGHLFTVTKAEFAVAFHKMLGEDAIFPFAFHCTGMPICGAARRLKDELDGVTKPEIKVTESDQGVKDLTQFHSRRSKLNAKTGTKEGENKGPEEVTYSTGKKQARILVEMGIGDNEESLRPFTDPKHWVEYFPPLGQKDLKKFGLRADWRRSFITTDANPYYDAFVRWQFEHLKEGGFIRYGTRNNIFCPIENESCPDHDRLVGESIRPQDYVCMLMKVIDNNLFSSIMCPVKNGYNGETGDYSYNEKVEENNRVDLSKYSIYLAAATLRPETAFGQTNCWVKPSGVYGVYLKSDINRLIVCTHRAARNMCYQGSLDYEESPHGRIPKCLGIVSGKMLISNKIMLESPLAVIRSIPLLPMEVVDLNVGTGIVMSVPADAPHDYASLVDLQKPHCPVRDENGLTLDDVKDIKPVPIITVPGLGDKVDGKIVKDESELNMSAMYEYRLLKIASQKDESKLNKAKEECYKKGFYEGIMLVGEELGIKGMKVALAKEAAKEYLIKKGQALTYSEPNGKVISRSNGECVVCPCTQWYISYGSDSIKPEGKENDESVKGYDWKQNILNMLDEMKSFGSQETKKQLKHTIEWMSDWGCSRGTGLGTRLPFDEKYLVESLSDSTIYMAYYTIAHLLQSDLYGTTVKINGKDGIPASMCDKAFFDYIFFGKPLPEDHPVNKDETYKSQMAVLRREFNYWYPVDLRVSGKDLVCNHLVMYMYNHAAIWNTMNMDGSNLKNGEETTEEAIDRCYYPKGIRASGHICVDGEKMSKSAGNFIIAQKAIDTFGCDGLRIGLAEGGDGYDDANFVVDDTTKNIMWLTGLISSIKDIVTAWSECNNNNETEKKELSYEDNIFLARLLTMEHSCRVSLTLMRYREFMITMRNIRKLYSDYTRMCMDAETMKSKENLELSIRYILNYIIMLSVVAPHVCDYIWRDVLGPVALAKLANGYVPSNILDISKYDFTKSLYSQSIPLITLSEEEKLESQDGITASENISSVPEDKMTNAVMSKEEINKYLKIWKYVEEVTSTVGKRIVAFNNQKVKASGNSDNKEVKLTNRSKHVTIVVATELPEMEKKIIDILRPNFNYETRTFSTDPKQLVRPLMDALTPAEAKQKGKIMAFTIATAKEAVNDPAVFDNEHIDERAILENFKSYFINTYNVASVSVTVDNSSPIAKPGKPMILIETRE